MQPTRPIGLWQPSIAGHEHGCCPGAIGCALASGFCASSLVSHQAERPQPPARAQRQCLRQRDVTMAVAGGHGRPTQLGLSKGDALASWTPSPANPVRLRHLLMCGQAMQAPGSLESKAMLAVLRLSRRQAWPCSVCRPWPPCWRTTRRRSAIGSLATAPNHQAPHTGVPALGAP